MTDTLKVTKTHQQYKLVSANTEAGLEREVNANLKKGWVVHGSPVYTMNASGMLRGVAQAIVKTVTVD